MQGRRSADGMQWWARRVCSVCGASEGTCSHVKGQIYGEQLCFLELQDPTDAYEWSFVAVPAQRNAGVVKRFGPEDGQMQVLRKQAELGRKVSSLAAGGSGALAMLADDAWMAGVCRCC